MKQIIYILCSVALIINLSFMSVARYHHHDCSGNIYIKVAQTYEYALNNHAVEKSDDEHGHSHHSHPCEDNCSLSLGNIMPAEIQHQIKFAYDQRSLHFDAEISKPEICVRQQNAVDKCITPDTPDYYPDYNPSSFLLRGPPSLLI